MDDKYVLSYIYSLSLPAFSLMQYGQMKKQRRHWRGSRLETTPPSNLQSSSTLPWKRKHLQPEEGAVHVHMSPRLHFLQIFPFQPPPKFLWVLILNREIYAVHLRHACRKIPYSFFGEKKSTVQLPWDRPRFEMSELVKNNMKTIKKYGGSINLTTTISYIFSNSDRSKNIASGISLLPWRKREKMRSLKKFEKQSLFQQTTPSSHSSTD